VGHDKLKFSGELWDIIIVFEGDFLLNCKLKQEDLAFVHCVSIEMLELFLVAQRTFFLEEVSWHARFEEFKGLADFLTRL